jgi:Na+/H+-dicarboxylate symporter
MSNISVLSLLMIPIACFFLFLLFISIRMLATDARRRGKSSILVVLLALVSFPLGLLIWLVFRPEPLDPNRRQFQLGDHRMQ